MQAASSGDCVAIRPQTRAESGAMLSAIVAYIDRNDAGPGF